MSEHAAHRQLTSREAADVLVGVPACADLIVGATSADDETVGDRA